MKHSRLKTRNIITGNKLGYLIMKKVSMLIYKNGTDEHICKAGIEMQTQRMDMWTWG